MLNLATVAQQYLHDNTLALQNYRAYLALTPRPANWDAVNDHCEQPGTAGDSRHRLPKITGPAPAPEVRPPPASSVPRPSVTVTNADGHPGGPESSAPGTAGAGSDGESAAGTGDRRDARGGNAGANRLRKRPARSTS